MIFKEVKIKRVTENKFCNSLIFKCNFCGPIWAIKNLPPAQKIVDYYRAQNRGTKYVFPILLQDKMTFSHLENRKRKMLKRNNNRLKEIGEVCEITKPLSSYVARHSYANCLKQKGIATDIISESLGHQNLAITQAYLKELDNTLVDEAMEVLL